MNNQIKIRKEFSEEYGLKVEDMIHSLFNLPVIPDPSISFENAPIEIVGHPVLWLPEEIRVMKGNEIASSYALRIFMLLKQLNLFLPTGGWIDVVYAELLLDVENEKDKEEIQQLIQEETLQTQIKIVPEQILEINEQVSELAIQAYNSFNEHKTQAYQKRFTHISSEVKLAAAKQNRIKTYRLYIGLVKEIISNKISLQDSNMIQDRLNQLINNFLFYHINVLKITTINSYGDIHNDTEYNLLMKKLEKEIFSDLSLKQQEINNFKENFFSDRDPKHLVAVSKVMKNLL